MDYGTVIATIEGPSTRRFSFSVKKDAGVRRGQFVQLKVEDGTLIGRVADIRKMNRYFLNPESVTNVEQNTSMVEAYPTSEWEYLVADVVALGVHTGTGFHDSNFPPSPGTVVEEPDQDMLERFFGLDRNGLHVGGISHHRIEAKINLTRLFHKHLAILAMSGAGKSYLMGVLIEELLKRGKEKGRLALVAIDPHGEYDAFADDPSFSGKTDIYRVADIRIAARNIIRPGHVSRLLKLSDAQSRDLSRVVSSLGKRYSISDIKRAVEENEDIKQATRDVLVARLEDIARTGLFGIEDSPKIEEMAKPGRLAVVDLSDTIDMRKKQIITKHVSERLFHARRRGVIHPFLLILEEAHQFVPEQMKAEEALAKGILQTIAREGRKFGASLCLISQRPKRLSTTILSQCNTNMILRITNPYDLDHIKAGSEGIRGDLIDQIPGLPVGTGLLVGEAVNFPLMIRIRARTSKESEKGKPLEQMCIEFDRIEEQKKEDSRAFM